MVRRFSGPFLWVKVSAALLSKTARFTSSTGRTRWETGSVVWTCPQAKTSGSLLTTLPARRCFPAREACQPWTAKGMGSCPETHGPRQAPEAREERRESQAANAQHGMVVPDQAALQTLKADTVSALDIVAPPSSGEIPRTEKDRIERINELHQGMARLGVQALKTAMQCGEILWTVRQDCKKKGHGVWAAWMEKNLTFTEKTARRYIQVYENRDRILRSLAAKEIQDLSSAYKLLAMRKPKNSTSSAGEESGTPAEQKDTAAKTNEDCETQDDEGQTDRSTGTDSTEDPETEDTSAAGSDEDKRERLNQRVIEISKYLDSQWANCRDEDGRDGVIEVVYFRLNGWMKKLGLRLKYGPLSDDSALSTDTLAQQESCSSPGQ